MIWVDKLGTQITTVMSGQEYELLQSYTAQHSKACVENKWSGEMKGMGRGVVLLRRLFGYMGCI